MPTSSAQAGVAAPRASASSRSSTSRGSAAARTPREFAKTIASCTDCDLHVGRVRPVVGDGPADARLMIVGAAPRQHEDLQGVAFAGANRNVLEHGLRHAALDPAEVRFTTVVRCRPPEDRAPTYDEVETCREHLWEEIRLVQPEVVVSLGSFVTAVLMGRRVKLERVAGYRLDILDGVTLVPTYHPIDAVRGIHQASQGIPRDLAVAAAVLDGRMRTGAEALAELRARLDAGE